MQRIKDSQANELYLDANKIYLKLGSTKRTLKIGELRKRDDKKIYYKVNNTKHIFRKNDSWGLNYSALDFFNDDDLIIIFYTEENTLYELTKKEVLEKGEFLWFKTEGFERQIFVKRANWNKKAKE